MKMSPELKVRHEEHDKWVREVRDPAEEHGEGLRVIEVAGASVEYEIAQLPDGRYAIRSSFCYHCGNYHGSGSPWSALESREACLEIFVNRARNHFGEKLLDGSVAEKQRQAQKAMLQALDGGLFGFVEPEVSQAATKRSREIQEFTKLHNL